MFWILLAQEHGGKGGPLDPMNVHEPAHWAAGAWAWGIFILLLVLLGKFAWGPIAKGLESRALRISESLRKAEEIEKAARELNETNKALMVRAQHEAQQIVTDARAAAQHAAEDVLKKAHADIESSRERFTKETQLLVEKARADLRKDTVELVLQTTAKLLGKTMTDADHRRIAEQSLRDAEAVARN